MSNTDMKILDQIKQETFFDKADAYHHAFKLLNFNDDLCVDVYPGRGNAWYVSSMKQEQEVN